MRKIMFNDRYNITDLVIDGKVTQTRRITPIQPVCVGVTFKEFKNINWGTCSRDDLYAFNHLLPYTPIKEGEIIAVGQSYADVINFYENTKNACDANHFEHNKSLAFDIFVVHAGEGYYASFRNKRFVSPELMPHKIKITNVRFQRMQDISPYDCKKEGIQMIDDKFGFFDNKKDEYILFDYPIQAYASLIDKINGKGTWDANPYVFVYDFELLK